MVDFYPAGLAKGDQVRSDLPGRGVLGTPLPTRHQWSPQRRHPRSLVGQDTGGEE